VRADESATAGHQDVAHRAPLITFRSPSQHGFRDEGAT
jgi:hypothetical protein